MRLGDLSRREAILSIALSSVAENNKVCRFAGVADAMVSTSSMKPMSSIRSASSSTSISKREKLMRPRWMWSIKRPGVATKISTGCDNNLFCNG